MKASLERRLQTIEETLAGRKHLSLPEIFFIPKGCEDIPAFEAQCSAATPKNRFPMFIEFIGPEGGPELGTGYLSPEEIEGSYHNETV